MFYVLKIRRTSLSRERILILAQIKIGFVQTLWATAARNKPSGKVFVWERAILTGLVLGCLLGLVFCVDSAGAAGERLSLCDVHYTSFFYAETASTGLAVETDILRLVELLLAPVCEFFPLSERNQVPVERRKNSAKRRTNNVEERRQQDERRDNVKGKKNSSKERKNSAKERRRRQDNGKKTLDGGEKQSNVGERSNDAVKKRPSFGSLLPNQKSGWRTDVVRQS
ncbi:hypothetical protein IW261DRAFT_1591949 [Armillaria novae-zelandiae]|uniref:Transmembrane protein n=1 Tax=Armillaria novae-zelandiae TaxID=153914 RepID=A0AA39TEH5_9AGAR|nr:hypothetical protein IW261DRAFT_1591949 [Armillaria novae-zelandiae]